MCGGPGGGGCDLALAVDVVEHLGGASYLHARLPGGGQVVVQRDAARRERDLERAVVSLSGEASYLFDAEGRRLR